MSRGTLEQSVLFALVALGGEAHGPAIIDEIEKRTGRRVSPGALYTVLERLAEKEQVEGWIGESTPDRGGRRRKVYRVLPEGARALQAWYDDVRALADGTGDLLQALADEVGG